MMQESMQLLLIGLLLITATPDRVLLKGKSRGGGVQKTAWEYWEGQKRVIATGCWVAAVTCCSVMLNSCRKDSPSKPSVAELAGRLKGQILPIPNSNDEVPFRRKPPSSLKFQSPEQENDESSKPASPSHIKIKLRNSAMIEKLQANLALSPTSLLPSPKAPEVKLQPTQLSPALACSPLSPPLRPPQPSSEEEDPISFDSPPEGTPLPSFNKTRARLSFKRRPPTRQHRRAAGEEVEAANGQQPPCELDLPRENGDKEQAESGHLGGLKENREEDCEKMEAEETQSDPDERGDLEQEVEQVTPAEALKEDQQLEGDDETEEQAKTPLEADSGEHGAI